MIRPNFSQWTRWSERNSLKDLGYPGVYALAVSTKNISGNDFNWSKKIKYFGMTNSVAGLKARLKQFDNTIIGKEGHGGGELDGIEIVLENPDDAKEAVNLILRKTDLFNREEFEKVKNIKVASFEKYETSAVNYKMIFLLEFVFDEDVSLDAKASLIKVLQEFFSQV